MDAQPAAIQEDQRGVRWVLALASCLLVALPFLWVRIPPITDLPQHLAQVRLFLEAVASPASAYRVQWDTPYALVYVPIGVAWALFEPLTAGRVSMLVLGVLWTLAAHGLAARRRRSPDAAVVVSAIFFNHAVYWGFLSFTAGWPVFVLWFLLIASLPTTVFRRADALRLLGTAALLYCSHVLWLIAAVAWLLLRAVRERVARAIALRWVLSIAPVLLVVAIWYPRLAAGGFSGPTMWFSTPTARLSYSWLVDATLGGITGTPEYLLGAVMALWVAVGVWQHRDRLSIAVDREMVLASALFIAMAFVLPSLHKNTIRFGERWLPPGVILLVLACPAPRMRLSVLRTGVLAVSAAFCLATAATWSRFERDDLSGLLAALDGLPPASRVIGLDFLKTSSETKGRPFLQTFAYAQVLKGGELNFSFAEFAPSPVVYRQPRDVRWTGGLEWAAELLQPSDFTSFDYALVNGHEGLHQAFGADPLLQAVTHTGRWRLYRVNHGAS